MLEQTYKTFHDIYGQGKGVEKWNIHGTPERIKELQDSNLRDHLGDSYTTIYFTIQQ